jgi:hypothetical protein
MANQKYRDENLRLLLWLLVLSMAAIPSTTPSNYCPQFSNVGQYPIAVTLGDNPNYTVVSTNGILSVTPKSIAVTVIADGKSKVYGMKILRLLLWLLVLSMAAIPSTIP